MKKVCLVIIDGFGIAADEDGKDATTCAAYIKWLTHNCFFSRLRASGRYVGLPENTVGNSEVGHMTIGTGRVVTQEYLRINEAYAKGEFQQRLAELSPSFTNRVHIVGLLSDGGVHSHVDHLQHLIACIPADRSVFVHAVADGRDTAPKSFARYSAVFDSIVSVAGRYYTMDRDHNEDRVERAFAMMTSGHAAEFNLDALYRSGVTDEFIEPVLIKQETIGQNDTVIFFNFRADRMREIVGHFGGFPHVYTMTEYGAGVGQAIFRPPVIINALPEWLSHCGATQAHIAETEKYAHVTYFFSGGNEQQNEGETRIMVKSPRVGNFDEQPGTAMADSARSCIEMIKKSTDFVVVNLAGPDLVGHTGHYERTMEAVRVADSLVHEIHEECKTHGYILLVTADHGNAEQMVSGNEMCKRHTANRVPLIIAGAACRFTVEEEHGLADVAPTILDLMELEIPREMTGRSLVVGDDKAVQNKSLD